MVFFVGHSAEVEGVPYLVPVEGEFDDPRSLIPLSWVIDQLAKCPARQKVLVLDGPSLQPNPGPRTPCQR